MNFLAHFHLAWPDDMLLLGALEGEYHRGPLRGELPDRFEPACTGVVSDRETCSHLDHRVPRLLRPLDDLADPPTLPGRERPRLDDLDGVADAALVVLVVDVQAAGVGVHVPLARHVLVSRVDAIW